VEVEGDEQDDEVDDGREVPRCGAAGGRPGQRPVVGSTPLRRAGGRGAHEVPAAARRPCSRLPWCFAHCLTACAIHTPYRSYEFVYRQAVGTHDAYLGMSGKDPSSTSCEDLVVSIQLPRASGAGELDLDVKPTRLRLTSGQ